MTDIERRGVISDLAIDIHDAGQRSAALAETVLAGLNYDVVSSLKKKLENATEEPVLTAEEIAAMASSVLYTHLRLMVLGTRQNLDLASQTLKGTPTNV